MNKLTSSVSSVLFVTVSVLTVFALLAASCGGSDDTAEISEPEAAATSIAATEDPEAAAQADEEYETTLPPVSESDVATERDCVHTAAELADTDGNAAVELPPAEKPAVADEYLVDVDELIVTDLIEGTGTEATAGAPVSMQYVGVLGRDGTQFDASWDRGAQPFQFTLGQGQVIAGWDQGIEGMKVGGRRVLQIPADLAYGDNPRGDVIGPGDDLVFIVDLLDVTATAPPVPEDTLGSFPQLEIIDLVDGDGCEAMFGDIALVNYVGVDAETGEQFDSSWSRGQTFSVIVGRSPVIDGWNQGIEGMKVGGERVLQIPSNLAYDEGDLVFRIHLEEIIEAPLAHTLQFDPEATPDKLEVTTLVEGTGEGASEGSIVNTDVVVMLHNTDVIVQSTYESGAAAQIVVGSGTSIGGLDEGLDGIKAGETRQIIIPADVAYPDGIPPQSGVAADDALVFVLSAIDLTNN